VIPLPQFERGPIGFEQRRGEIPARKGVYLDESTYALDSGRYSLYNSGTQSLNRNSPSPVQTIYQSPWVLTSKSNYGSGRTAGKGSGRKYAVREHLPRMGGLYVALIIRKVLE